MSDPAGRLPPRGVFAGLCTLDVVQLVDGVPAANRKIVARRQAVAAGGPATNAAVTFARLGGVATLLAAVGEHGLAAGIRADLHACRITLADLAAGDPAPPGVASIMVTGSTGERAVVSSPRRAAAGLAVPGRPELSALLDGAAIVVLDGHLPQVALPLAGAARERGVLTLLDAGSWKPGTAELIALTDVVVCSADFRPPDRPGDVPAWLVAHGVTLAAVTHGPGDITWRTATASGRVPVPPVAVVDTLGAGDVLHGALAHRLATAGQVPSAPAAITAALADAAGHAARSCTTFGTRG